MGWLVVRPIRPLADHLEAHGRGRHEAGHQLDPEVPVRCRYPREEVRGHVLVGASSCLPWLSLAVLR